MSENCMAQCASASLENSHALCPGWGFRAGDRVLGSSSVCEPRAQLLLSVGSVLGPVAHLGLLPHLQSGVTLA